LAITTGATTIVLKGPATTACNVLVVKAGLAV
jgi:hypothetical protein